LPVFVKITAFASNKLALGGFRAFFTQCSQSAAACASRL
jgi:hypothetical protein